ncbi:MAG: hypothetical protein J7621_22565 [Niastella sp.]|nr:hypothetical protein [Niastella sp.]
MKRIQNYLLLLAAMAGVIISSCQKEKSLETGGVPLGAAAWEFKEGSTEFKGPMDTAYYSTIGGVSALVLEGTSTNFQDDFYLEVYGTTITAGTYATPAVYFEYISGGSAIYSNDPLALNKFSVTISKIDREGVTGTFSGEVQDAAGNVKTISGKFTGKFATTPPPPPGTGQLMLWAKQGCGNNLLTFVNGQKDTITSFQTAAPSCGTAGTALFTLAPGNYTWKAVCEGATDTVSGSVTITDGSCTAREVVLNGTPPPSTCIISNIGSYALNGAKISAITSTFNAQNQVIKTQLIDSSSQTGGTIDNEFNINRVTSRINIDANQYFVLDANGRIQEFHGYVDPSDNTSFEVIITYTYYPTGYMKEAFLSLAIAPGNPVLVYSYTWTSNNLTKVTMSYASGEKSVIDYQYDATRSAKGFLSFHANTELTIFQNAVNFGLNSTNVPTRSTWQDFLANGNPDGAAYVSDFKNYVYDANGYVKSFEITGDGSVYGADIRHVLSYRCF